jgi:hypothetical protein
MFSYSIRFEACSKRSTVAALTAALAKLEQVRAACSRGGLFALGVAGVAHATQQNTTSQPVRGTNRVITPVYQHEDGDGSPPVERPARPFRERSALDSDRRFVKDVGGTGNADTRRCANARSSPRQQEHGR